MPLVESQPKRKEVSVPMVTLPEPAVSKKLEIPESVLLGAAIAASLLAALWLIFVR